MHLVIFEGCKWHTFAPLSLSRPVFALSTGACTLLEKQVRHFRPTRLTLWVRPGLAGWCKRELAPRFAFPVNVNTPLDDEPAALMSGRTLHFVESMCGPESCVLVDDEGPAGGLIRRACVTMPGLSHLDALDRTDRWRSILDLPRCGDQARMADFVWDLLAWNEESLVEDFVALSESRPSQQAPEGAYYMVNPDNLWLGRQVSIDPGVVLDASKGPIMLDDACEIGANSVLRGPCYVGPQTQIRPLTVLGQGTTIGPLCRFGGEISNSIVVGCSHKWHDGYMGDSYIGQWVNLGAGTTTSNLRNTYSTVKVRIAGKEYDSGRRYLGSLIGDHTKTAIGTRLMTGSYIGYNTMLATSTIPPTFVPSFSFLTDAGRQEYLPDKALEVMRVMHQRKNVPWPEGEEETVAAIQEYAKEVEG